jgi:hypothetical protein
MYGMDSAAGQVDTGFAIDSPQRGDCCPDCGEQRVIVAYCGRCAEAEDEQRARN